MLDFSYSHTRTVRSGEHDEGRQRGEVSVEFDGRAYYYRVRSTHGAREFRTWLKSAWAGMRDHDPVISGRWPEYRIEGRADRPPRRGRGRRLVDC